ncbi:hypothetical protein MIJ3_00076 [Pseudomonas phage vB_PaeM_MIJ3]|uniref:Structural protein n=1 Tax=Pseudomonas phage vB_PaeM_PA5oct TaxID=2163605 RepID=A0A4Y1LUU3_9CAUD|nr:structural protein [Pseudomonas phage vB_PaeM_PA5oct]WPK38708.1 hypothetical protein Cassandra_0032 [Pseudomonas phage Cassandra]WPK39229.1 hypothetical protein Deiofobo_0032 [Pseudomonas phage Deifobo]WPK40262.1 hypothetical protein Paride_0032 [Pseudomonas phage Paride]VOH53928.1 hypothetical protein MIJ3_00076 [Pseudomonas phage vB_PaeM_MIJ3]QCG76116.1 structural protein [Pseudomonas phage vB_PaeM_PA5oct]
MNKIKLEQILKEQFGLNELELRSFMKYISFKDFVALTESQDHIDSDIIKHIVESLDNSYSAVRDTSIAPNQQQKITAADLTNLKDTPNFKKLKTGDKLTIANPESGNPKDVTVKNKTIAGNTITINTSDGGSIVQSGDSIIPVTPNMSADDATKEIDRIKKLAGISNDSAVDESSFMSSAAISGVVTPLGEIKRRHKKPKKPGPKPKK